MVPFFQDEEPETSWMLIQENDLIALFSQFPFDAIFKHLLKMDPNIHSKLDSGLFNHVANHYFEFNVILFNLHLDNSSVFALCNVDNSSSTT